MTRRFIAALALVCAFSSLPAQVACDPLDYFYEDLTIWETMGIVTGLPSARPYPLQLVKEILAQVAEKGDATQRKAAEAHSKRVFGRILYAGGKGSLSMDLPKKKKQMDVAISFDANYVFHELVAASASVDGWATTKLPNEEIASFAERSTKDIVEDNAKAGPFWVLPSLNSSISFGTSDTYLNAGMMRGSWGPIHDNGVLFGSHALHSGQLNAAVVRPLWNFNYSLYSLSATSDRDPNKYYPEKYLAIHSFAVKPKEWLEVSFFESVMYGNRFEPLYMLPVSAFMISQGNTGFSDNNYIGGMFTVRPLEGLKVDGTLVADDLSFNDIVTFKWDTKWRIAGQLAASYAPRKSGILTRVSMDYTMVTPYTYSHKEGDSLNASAPNFQSYTHAGSGVGAALDPNSDRLNARVRLRPLEALDFDLVGTLVRHANVNEGIDYKWVKEYLTHEGSYTTTGTVHNSSGSGVGHAYFYETPFLSQKTIQYALQTGFDVNCRLPILKTGGLIVFKLGYRFEMIKNPGVNAELYAYDPSLVGLDDDAIRAAAAAKLESWREAASGTEYNNYVTAGMEYFY